MTAKRAVFGVASCSVLALILSQYGQSFATLCASLSFALLTLSLLLNGRTSIICTVLAATCFGLFLAEATLFLMPTPEQARTPRSHHDPNSDYVKQYFVKTDLGFQAREGVHSSKRISSDGTVIYDVVYSIGQDGFRITPNENIDNAFRINLFGCSVAFGEGLNDNETIAFYLTQEMPNVSVKNFGLHGYGVHQALAILQSNRDTKGQINLLVTAPWHAPRSSCMPSYTVGSPKFIADRSGMVQRYGECGIRNYPDTVLLDSRLYTLIQKTIADANQDEQINLYLTLIEEMARISKERGQTLIIGFIRADSDWFVGKYSNGAVLSRLKNIANEVVDLTLADSGEHISPKHYLHETDKHPTALANRERANLLISVLRSI